MRPESAGGSPIEVNGRSPGSQIGKIMRTFRSLPLAARSAPFSFAILSLSTVLMAIAPPLQLQVILSIVDNGQVEQSQIVLLAAALVVNLTLPTVSGILEQRLSWETLVRAESYLAGAFSRISPVRVRSEETRQLMSAARQAARPLAWQAASLLTLLAVAVSTLGIFLTIFQSSPLLALLILASAVPMFLASAHLARIQEHGWDEIYDRSRRADYLTEQLSQGHTSSDLASLNTRNKIAQLVVGGREAERLLHVRMSNKSLRVSVLAAAISSLLIIAILVVLFYGPQDALSSLGGLFAVVSAVSAVHASGSALGQLQTAAAQVEPFYRVKSEDGRSENRVGVGAGEVRRLSVRGLSLSYGSDAFAVDGVSFEAKLGQIVGLVGENGAGKTTLVRGLTGSLVARAGTAEIDGRSLLGGNQERSYLGHLSQEFGRYELTVRQALELGSEHASVAEELLWEALRNVGLDSKVAEIGGLDSQLGEQWGGAGLSGGQWQRLALARMYVRDAPIWVLDEPTSSVDGVTEEQLFARLAEQKCRRITVIVTHRAWTLKHADIILVMKHGKIVESGTFEELSSAEGSEFSRLFKLQLVGKGSSGA